MNTIKLRNHPDSGQPRLTKEETAELYAAYMAGDALLVGRCDSGGKGSLEVVAWGDRYFIFLNDVGPSEWAWEVSEQGAKNYCV